MYGGGYIINGSGVDPSIILGQPGWGHSSIEMDIDQGKINRFSFAYGLVVGQFMCKAKDVKVNRYIMGVILCI